MLRNFIKVALRNLARNRISSFINIGGLAMGMAVAMLIGLWMYSELSFNKNFRHYDRIAQVMQNQNFAGEIQTWSNQARQLAPQLRENYGSNFKQVVLSGSTGTKVLSYADKRLKQTGTFMEPGVIDLLSLHLLKGSRSALNEMNSVILSASTAKAIFNNADPIGKVIKIRDELDVKVTGVYEDIPLNSTFANLQFIAPWQLLVKADNLEERAEWGNSWFNIYVQIADNTTMQKVSAAIKDSKLKGIGGQHDESRFKSVIFLHPMSKWHLYGEFENGVNTGGNIQYVWLFGITGAIVLLLACINFMNLSTARSEKRAKEVGIRKTIGSMRTQLIGQFFSESLVVSLFAFLMALALVVVLLPLFNEVADKKMELPWGQPLFWLTAIGFSVLTGLIAGSYPALYLSSFKPVKVLKGTFKVGRFAALPRKVLVVIQFTASVSLIIATMMVFKQIKHAQTRPIGYNNNGLVSVPLQSKQMRQHFEAFRSDLMQTGVVAEAAGSENRITETHITNSGFTWPGKPANMQEEFVTVRVTPDFGKTVGWRIKEGRDFGLPGDSMSFVINETCAKYMGLKNPVGTQINWGGETFYTIIGVVEDMITQSPYSPVRQTLFLTNQSRFNMANVKLKPTVSASQAMERIGAVYKKYDADNAFEFSFMDEEYGKKFTNETRVGKLAGFFTMLAVLISCLGLFGLASFVAEQRTKEIGVRKVLGASVLDLCALLSREFVLLVCIAAFIAGPVAYYFMQNWLQNFEYRTEFSWWVFAVTGVSALFISLATVSFQSVKAALMNPVKSLRSE